MKIVIIGNSGSGKSTLARRLAGANELPHLDLDEVAWQTENPTSRRPVEESVDSINAFTERHEIWVIEGCYSYLIEYVAPQSDALYFLNLTVQGCIENCRNRPWEPHKYKSKEAQDQNLSMLIEWVQDYFTRDDDFSYASHRRIFDEYVGTKFELRSNQEAREVRI